MEARVNLRFEIAKARTELYYIRTHVAFSKAAKTAAVIGIGASATAGIFSSYIVKNIADIAEKKLKDGTTMDNLARVARAGGPKVILIGALAGTVLSARYYVVEKNMLNDLERELSESERQLARLEVLSDVILGPSSEKVDTAKIVRELNPLVFQK